MGRNREIHLSVLLNATNLSLLTYLQNRLDYSCSAILRMACVMGEHTIQALEFAARSTQSNQNFHNFLSRLYNTDYGRNMGETYLDRKTVWLSYQEHSMLEYTSERYGLTKKEVIQVGLSTLYTLTTSLTPAAGRMRNQLRFAADPKSSGPL